MLNLFEKNWYVFVCFLSTDTVYLKIYSPQLIQEMLLADSLLKFNFTAL